MQEIWESFWEVFVCDVDLQGGNDHCPMFLYDPNSDTTT